MKTKTIKTHTKYPSQFAIGDPVYAFDIPGNIRVILFTNGKVRYSVQLEYYDSETQQTHPTTIHNVDSFFVKERKGESMEWEFDNYS